MTAARTPRQLEGLVHEALRCAQENGYWLSTQPTPGECSLVADDLVRCSADLEDERPDALLPHVVSYFARKS